MAKSQVQSIAQMLGPRPTKRQSYVCLAIFGVAKHWRNGVRFILTILICTLLTACERDAEVALRSQLDQWFYLGTTAFFISRSRCTGAMIDLESDRMRPSIPVQTNPDRAKAALAANGVAAIQIEGMTPTALTDAMLLSGTGEFGKQALAAGALAVSCFKGTEMGDLLYEALNTPGATLAYDMKTAGLMVLDPGKRRLFYVAGDIW